MIRRQLSGYLGTCQGNRGTPDVPTALEGTWPWWRVNGHLQLFVLGQMFPHRLWTGIQLVSHGCREVNEMADASCAFGHHGCDTALDRGTVPSISGCTGLERYLR